MKKPIKKGDRCIVIAGMARHKSPNIGLEVLVGLSQGYHSEHGRVWRCTGDGIKQMNDTGAFIDTDWADFPVNWLQKIEPDSTSTTNEAKKTLSTRH